MSLPDAALNRRRFLTGTAAGATSLLAAGAWADQLALTPRQTEGPFYPDKLPLDTDNDLLVVNDTLTPATGEVTHFAGQVLSQSGEPLRNVVVEIWQADRNGVYLHSRGGDREQMDPNFQGFGRFLTNGKGEYYFRTIRPVPYGPRTPHIHIAVKQGDRRLLTTQCYIKGHPMNERDGVLRGTAEGDRSLLMADFRPLPDSAAGEYSARFDLIVGRTPEDPDEAPRRGGRRGRPS